MPIKPFRCIHRLLVLMVLWCLGVSCQSALATEKTPALPPEPLIPQRVVSMNLCTDQLALLLAKPGQLISVSHFSHDEQMAVLAHQAKHLPFNRGRAEEIFNLKADLVLAGSFSDQATLHLLRHLGHRVETFAPAYSFAELRSNIVKMGKVLTQTKKAQQLLQAFDQRLKSFIRKNPGTKQRTATSYGANLYMQGAKSLEREMVEHAGFKHYGAQQGFAYGGRLSLEALVVNPPDVLLMSNYQQGMQAFAHLVHPALSSAVPPQHRSGLQTKYWICGLPFVLDAVQQLIKLRQQIE